jgi:hypothetical protein
MTVRSRAQKAMMRCMSDQPDLRAVADVDEYRLPAGVLGRHPDEFYGALGRIVGVSAVLEDKVTILRHTLANAQQDEFTHEPVSSQIKAARTLCQGLPDHAASRIKEFLDAAQEAFVRRNDLVHSSFPAQPDGRVWGHRPTRARDVTDGTAATVETSIDDVRAFIAHLADLVESFNGVHALAATGRP